MSEERPGGPDTTGGTFFPRKDPRIDSVVMSTYRIVALLAEGGIGTIYRAQYLSSDEPIAIKFLRGEYSGQPEVAARFEREMKLLVVLGHENIVRAFDCGTTPEGELYLVMELAPGETLRAVNDRLGALPLPTALAIARQIGAALTRAHSLGVVHRDLKPENVIVTGAETGAPRLKVLDFGMAGIAGGLFAGAALTQAGSVFGSPSYMAPEQVLARKVDGRGDQYALGVMLYEMLAGAKPFRAEDPIELLKMQVSAPLPSLARAAPRVPESVVAVVERMLSKDPEQRFPDVAAAVDALVAAAGGAPSEVAASAVVPAAVPATPAVSRGLDRRSRVWIAVVAGVTLLGLAGIALARWG